MHTTVSDIAVHLENELDRTQHRKSFLHVQMLLSVFTEIRSWQCSKESVSSSGEDKRLDAVEDEPAVMRIVLLIGKMHQNIWK